MDENLTPLVLNDEKNNHEIGDGNNGLKNEGFANPQKVINDCFEDMHFSNIYADKTHAEQSLLEPLLAESHTEEPQVEMRSPNEISKRRKHLAVFVLFLINLLNYMDRFTIAGVLLAIQQFFGVDNASAGLLQTIFIVSYMLVAPIFGYLGDRYNRKILILVGMIIWSGCTLASSFITNKSNFLVFLALRGLVGIGEASYSTIAPTIIADLFVKTKRSRMLSVFYFATPVGSGLGYVVGSQAARIGGSWHWALRVTPALGVITMILMLIIIPNPRRGASETEEELALKKGLDRNRSSYLKDLGHILRNPTFVWVTIGNTFMAFVVGCLTLWGPVFVAYSQIVSEKIQPCTDAACEYSGISFIFGLITCIGGFAGVWTGAESAKKWKDCGNKNADAHVCAIGLIAAAPLLFFGFHFATINVNAAWVFIFFADVFLCFTWTLVADMSLYVILPTRRSTAQAVQILTMHLFGDAGSPYLVGVISDALAADMPDTYYTRYITLLRAVYCTLFASVLGGGGFLLASLYLQRDKKRVDDYLTGKSSLSNSTTSISTASESYTSDEPDLTLQTGSIIEPPELENEQNQGLTSEESHDFSFEPSEPILSTDVPNGNLRRTTAPLDSNATIA